MITLSSREPLKNIFLSRLPESFSKQRGNFYHETWCRVKTINKKLLNIFESFDFYHIQLTRK
jgi:hypothetical protein